MHILLLHGLGATADVWSGLADLLVSPRTTTGRPATPDGPEPLSRDDRLDAPDHSARPDQLGPTDRQSLSDQRGNSGQRGYFGQRGDFDQGRSSNQRDMSGLSGQSGPGGFSWTAPDLPGHGAAAPLPAYTFADIASTVADLIDPAGTVIVGHSFGGVVALHLADRPGVRSVVGVGIKVVWTPAELEKAAALAARPVRVFATREEAEARHARVAGVPASPGAVIEVEGGWRTAHDPRTFAVGDPMVPALLASVPAAVRVVLARGEHDPMVSHADLAALVPDPVDLPGLGHNAHVEKPSALFPLI